MARTSEEPPVGDRVRQAVVELYAAAPADFVPLRTALVKQARADKDRDSAQEIAALRKPSTSAWAVNQVVRQDRPLVARLGELGAALRHAQSTLDGAALAALRRDRDDVLASLVRAAEQAAAGQGQSLSDTVRAEVRDTAIAALADAGAEEVAWSGSLTRALQYSGFGEVDVSDAVARTSTGVLLARIEGGAGQTEPEVEELELDQPEVEQPEDEQPEDEEHEDEAPSDEDGESQVIPEAGLEEAQLALEVAEHELAARSAQLRLVRTRHASTTRRREQVEGQLSGLEAEAADLEAQLTELTSRLDSVRGRVSELQSQAERCRAEDTQAAQTVSELETAVAAAEAQRDEVAQRVAGRDRSS